MNLIDVQNILEAKNKKRNQLIGQKELRMETLKDQGFSTVKEAKNEIIKLTKKKKKLIATYKAKEQEFKEKYEDLINGIWSLFTYTGR